jgi:hypothetical protein
MELEELTWRDKKGLAGSSTASPTGSATDDGHDDTAAAGDAAAAAEGEPLGNIAGINDDGYFGDASGQWLSLEPDTEITFATRSDQTVSKECRP